MTEFSSFSSYHYSETILLKKNKNKKKCRTWVLVRFPNPLAAKLDVYSWADHRPVDCLGRVLALEELVEVLRTVRGREPASPSVFRDSYQLQLLIHFHNNIKNSSPYQLVYLWETAALNSHVKDVTRIYRLTRGVDVCRFSVKDNSGKQVQKSTIQPNRSSVVTCLIKDRGHCLWEKKQSSISVCQRNPQPQMIENWVPSCSLASVHHVDCTVTDWRTGEARLLLRTKTYRRLIPIQWPVSLK